MGKAKKIETIINTGVRQLYYSSTGKWFMNLEYFPGALFDPNGYIVFETEAEYLNNENLKHGIRLNVPDGISQAGGYRRYTEEQRNDIAHLF